jgi:hypothetical protein
MTAEGWLVDEEITTGRFRRRRALRVDWARKPWSNAGTDTASRDPAAAVDEPAPYSADDDPGQFGHWRGQMIDQLAKQGGVGGALTARHPHRLTITACAATREELPPRPPAAPERELHRRDIPAR